MDAKPNFWIEFVGRLLTTIREKIYWKQNENNGDKHTIQRYGSCLYHSYSGKGDTTSAQR